MENLKKYRTVAPSVEIRTCIFETGRVTKKKQKDNIECVSVQIEDKKIVGGWRDPDRSCIERYDARYRYVAEARPLICDPETEEVWIQLNDQWEIDRKDRKKRNCS